MSQIVMARPFLLCGMTTSRSDSSRERSLLQIVEDYVEIISVDIGIIATDFRDF